MSFKNILRLCLAVVLLSSHLLYSSAVYAKISISEISNTGTSFSQNGASVANGKVASSDLQHRNFFEDSVTGGQKAVSIEKWHNPQDLSEVKWTGKKQHQGIKLAYSRDVDNLLKNTRKVSKGKSKIYEKSGGFNQAKKDFYSLRPSNVRTVNTNKGLVTVGKLRDGTNVSVRKHSSGNKPTLQIGNKIKIRY